MVYDNGKFVGLGYPASFLTSDDGTNWIEHPSGITNHIRSIAFSNGQFVALSEPEYDAASERYIIFERRLTR